MLINIYNVISVMSGTSLDGIDILYAKFQFTDKWNYHIYKFETVKYPEFWVELLKHLTQYSSFELRDIDNSYSKYLANQIKDFIDRNEIKDIDFISSHGHTALHKPDEGYTYQIGNQQILSDTLGKKVICDFRIQDVKLGGQGAPLVPIGDKLLFNEYKYCINLGGFSNISFESNDQRVAFDICPVNIVLNHYANQLNLEYDAGGDVAKSGTVFTPLLEHLNELQFYNLETPKSLGLEWVEAFIFPMINKFKLEVRDILRTFVEHIVLQVSKYLNEGKALITGGGVYNNFLINRLEEFSKAEIIIPDVTIIECKEALVFGLLGVLKDRNEVNCLKSVTGAKTNHSSGRILTPKINS
ncbi:MAG: anhydro-N-acetylmuramic acid kinase [Winogradskyella sp.]|uniref:anhydro-N-acetylmuramic acid kinase n=1 Tax=Winogradskyella sp. TaxID=1883156 RepID=UPI000F3D87E5|nr:anhydro-N-acetylmuramic acid kinase [Winogradskyella sp.]RNC83586.1 MAG: anhydro-N-acetylmuramic acid kinase [Winogradskyella sp.]